MTQSPQDLEKAKEKEIADACWALQQDMEAEISKLKEELADYKDSYNAAKSGLREDEVHCPCAYELQADLSVAIEALEKFFALEREQTCMGSVGADPNYYRVNVKDYDELEAAFNDLKGDGR